ncbi:hypothetical protein cypCar_00001853, partial [Cyprinus carpio]
LISCPLGSRMCIHPNINGFVLDDGGLASVCDGTSSCIAFPSFWDHEVLVASVYFKDFHLLLLGVICLAKSIKKWSLHRRIALRLVTGLGVNPGMYD